MNKYTDTKAKNSNKKYSRYKVANDIKKTGKCQKVIHYLGGPNTSTPFENFFSNGRHTTFIRYEIEKNTQLPDNYLDESSFKNCQVIDTLIDYCDGKEGKEIMLNELKNFKKEINSKYGCFVNGNIFNHYEEYVKMFPKLPHHFWLDFCGAPKPQLLQKVMEIVNAPYSKEVYVTLFMNHRGRDSVKGIINYYGKSSLMDRAKSLKSYCEAMMPEKTNVICEVFDTYNNDKSPMAVLKFKKKEKVVLKKSIQEYVEASKRFSNKQLVVLWKMPTMKIAGLAAAAKRKKLV
jgi:hypothetical protein